jgi:dihydroxy-acid dehydratase
MSQEGTARRDGSQFSDESVDGFIARAFMRGGGRSAEAVRRRPVVGICSSWSELNPCNGGLRDVAAAVKRGVLAAGGFPLEFPTISISEPFSRPSSLLLRNLMSMDVEQMIRCSPLDAVVLLGGCDKTVPAQLMAAVSADIPTVAVTSGPRPVGRWKGAPLTIDDLWTMADERRRGALADADWARLEGCLNGGFGTCNVMGTATTMSAVAEVLGFAMPGSSLAPSGSAARLAVAETAGSRAVAAAEGGGAAALVNKQSLENAFRVVCAIGGSTNAVIHLSAIAGRAGIRLDLEHFRAWAETTPILVDVRPAGRHLLADLDAEGGVPAVIRELAPLLDLTQPTSTGRTWGEAIVDLPELEGNGSLHRLDDPVRRGASIAVLQGSLAPEGAVVKRSAASDELLRHVGPAVCFDGVEDLNARINDPGLDIHAGSVLVLRGAGPRGGPGMPEVGHLPIPTRLLKEGVTDMVRISDARMSGTATGTVVLHVAPEAAAGGPLHLVRDGDLISLDVDGGRLDLLVPEDELQRRAPAAPSWFEPARGYDRLHYERVLQAPAGCDFDFLRHESLAGT